ncbi:hypothetical protein Hanom_Chr16g01483231 [Helianthus anomalus]
MSAFDYILLGDPFGVEIEQKEIHEGGPSMVRRTKHVRIVGYLESVPLQPIMDGSSTKSYLPRSEGPPEELLLLALLLNLLTISLLIVVMRMMLVWLLLLLG